VLTWTGLIARLTESFLSRIAGKQVELSRDRRHRAAKALLKFYYSVVEANEVLVELLQVFERALQIRKPVRFSKDLVPLENRISAVNDELSRQFGQLVSAISIFDPALASLLYSIRGFKTTSLTAFGMLLERARFRIEFGGLHPFDRIVYSTFKDDVLELDIASLLKHAPKDFSESFEPSDLNGLVEALAVLLIEEEFSASDFDKLAYLRDRLRAQKAALETAGTDLRSFLANQFNFSDLLYAGPKAEPEFDLPPLS
jgi:hypothetical protein